MEKAGWIRPTNEKQPNTGYLCRAANRETEKTNVKAAETTISEIGARFKAFADNITPLTSRIWSQQELEEVLLNWIVATEGYERKSISDAADKRLADPDKEKSEPKIAGAAITKTEETYLCARFIQEIAEIDKNLFDNIVDLSALALLTEVIFDFRQPPQMGRKELDLTVFLDAPFVMDAMGLSGKVAEQNAQAILAGLKKLECKLAIFKHGCDEISDNLRAVLSQKSIGRFGRTAGALNRGEVQEDFAREVARDPEHFIKTMLGLNLVDQNIDQFPNQHKFFSKELFDDFASRVFWHQSASAAPRMRDGLSVALVIRRRDGRRVIDPLKSKCILLSQNWAFCNFSLRFCREKGLVVGEQIGPLIHQRRVAAILWLTLGTQERKELSRRSLLAACEQVTRMRPELIARARDVLRAVSPASREQLDALLTIPRSSQLLLDLTLGVERVIQPDNALHILEEMKKAAFNEAQNEAAGEIKAVRDAEKTRRQKLTNALDVAEKRQQAALGALQSTRDYERNSLFGWMTISKEYERRLVRYQRYIIIGIATIGFLASIGVLIVAPDSTLYILLSLLGSVVSLLFGVAQAIFHFPNVFAGWIEKKDSGALTA